jgi:hypothetical protein
MSDEKGLQTALDDLWKGLQVVIFAPFSFILYYFVNLIRLPFTFFEDLFDSSTP